MGSPDWRRGRRSLSVREPGSALVDRRGADGERDLERRVVVLIDDDPRRGGAEGLCGGIGGEPLGEDPGVPELGLVTGHDDRAVGREAELREVGGRRCGRVGDAKDGRSARHAVGGWIDVRFRPIGRGLGARRRRQLQPAIPRGSLSVEPAGEHGDAVAASAVRRSERRTRSSSRASTSR